MNVNLTMNTLQELLFFPLKDAESRKKLFVASAIEFAGFIIPIIPRLFVLGYAGEIARQIIVKKEEPHMPEWENWSEYLSFGAKLFGVYIIYAIPMLLPMFAAYFIMMLPGIVEIFNDSRHAYGTPALPPEWMMFSTFGGMILFGLGMLFSLFLFVFLPPAMSHVVAKDSFAAGFSIREWWKIFRENLGGFILSMVVTGGLYMVLMLVIQLVYMTIILCCLLPFLLSFVMAYMNIVVFTLFAQAYRDGQEKLKLQPIIQSQ